MNKFIELEEKLKKTESELGNENKKLQELEMEIQNDETLKNEYELQCYKYSNLAKNDSKKTDDLQKKINRYKELQQLLIEKKDTYNRQIEEKKKKIKKKKKKKKKRNK